MNCFLVPMWDPLLLEPGTLIKVEKTIIGYYENSGENSVLFKNEIFMHLDIQPSRKSNSHFKFKMLGDNYFVVETTLDEYKKLFSIIYRPEKS